MLSYPKVVHVAHKVVHPQAWRISFLTIPTYFAILTTTATWRFVQQHQSVLDNSTTVTYLGSNLQTLSQRPSKVRTPPNNYHLRIKLTNIEVLAAVGAWLLLRSPHTISLDILYHRPLSTTRLPISTRT